MYNKCRDPNQAKKMRFSELKYWDKWNSAIDKGLEEAYNIK